MLGAMEWHTIAHVYPQRGTAVHGRHDWATAGMGVRVPTCMGPVRSTMCARAATFGVREGGGWRAEGRASLAPGWPWSVARGS